MTDLTFCILFTAALIAALVWDVYHEMREEQRSTKATRKS